jgi:hypothetical protein
VSDFNSFGSSASGAFRDSGFDARGRNALFLSVGQSGGVTNFPAGIIGDCLQLYAYSPTIPLPDFLWFGGTVGDLDEGWGRKSFTIRYWWKQGSVGGPGGGERIFFSSLGFSGLQAKPEGLRFFVWTGAAYEFALWTDSFTLDAWHRTIVWYDADALEIGIQVDDGAPVTTAISGPIPGGATETLRLGEGSLPPVNAFDYSLDEFSIWHDYVLTSGERSADWNAGAATGWPDVLGAVSKRPMAYFRFEEPEDYFTEGVASMV